MAHSPEEIAATMVANLPEKTGKSLEEWLALVRGSSCVKHKEIVTWLKSDHGMTHGFANLVAAKYLEAGQPENTGDDLVAAQYSGTKAGLLPIYKALLNEICKFGNDIEVSPKKAYVSLRRNKQFAIIQPSTKTRVDVGLNLKSRKPEGRLEASGSFNSMVSHRVRASEVADVDQELIAWLKEAYESS